MEAATVAIGVPAQEAEGRGIRNSLQHQDQALSIQRKNRKNEKNAEDEKLKQTQKLNKPEYINSAKKTKIRKKNVKI